MDVFLTNKTAFLFNHSLAFVAAKVNIKEAELLFQAGVLAVPVVKKYAIDDGWVVTLHGRHQLNLTLETARGQVRVFKRLDAAVELLFKMGFGEVRIVR